MGSISATVWKVGAGGRGFNFRERMESMSGRSRDQLSVPREREERAVGGSISGTE